MKQPKILVVGSINMDLFVEGANAIPRYGESIRCRHYGYAPGGKGSNQAFAVAKRGSGRCICRLYRRMMKTESR